jgi:hypothetical protein
MKMKTSFLAMSVLGISSLSHAGFSPIDDAELGDITGQAGVTIEAEVRATIGSVVYTDEGSISVNNIVFGGANKQTYFGEDWGNGSYSGNALDGFKVKIDVQADGDLAINGGLNAALGGGLVDLGISTGSLELMSADGLVSSTLIDSINITGLFKRFRAIVDAETLHTEIDVTFAVDDMDIDVAGLNMKVENAFIVNSTYFEAIEKYGEADIDSTTANFVVDVYADDDGLHVDPLDVVFDMGIGGIVIADASIGSLALDNIDLSNLSVTISGHP